MLSIMPYLSIQISKILILVWSVCFFLVSMTALAQDPEHQIDLPDADDNSSWQLQLEKNGVQIFTQDWPESSFVAVKTVQVIHSSLSNITGNFIDIASFPDWVENMREARWITPFNSQRIRKVYIRMGLPWPVQDRDIIMGQKMSQNPLNLRVNIKEWNEGKTLPEVSGAVRVPEVNAEFVLIPISKNQTKIIWQGHNEPGGYVPAFLMNWMVENVFYKSAMAMRARFESEKYFKQVDWVKDFNEITVKE